MPICRHDPGPAGCDRKDKAHEQTGVAIGSGCKPFPSCSPSSESASMSCNQTHANRSSLASNAGAMAAGYAPQAAHALAADHLCRRPQLHPARQEDGRRAAIRHYLNINGHLLPAAPAQTARPGLVERARQACASAASAGLRQAAMLAGQLSHWAMAFDVGLRFPMAAAETPSCATDTDGDQACVSDGGSRTAGQHIPRKGGVSIKFSASSIQADILVSHELHTAPGGKHTEAATDTSAGASQTYAIKSALAVHAHGGDLGQVDALLNAGANVNEADANGNTALMVAVRMGQASIARRLLEAGADADLANRDGVTALHLAAMANNEEIARMLLEKRPQLDRREVNGWTPLFIAVHEGHHGVMHALLGAGADPNAAVSGTSRLNGMTPLEDAVLHKEHRIVGMLLQAGADVHHPSPKGRTALLYAVQREDPEMVDLLSRADAHPYSMPPGEESAFDLAVESGRHDMVASMLRHPKTHPCPTRMLITALERAVHLGDLKMISLLLEHGAAGPEVQAAALNLAFGLENGPIADLLRRHGERQPS